MDLSEFKTFNCKIDADGNGFVSPDEFKKWCKCFPAKSNLRLTDEQIQESIRKMDKDCDGMFSFKEVVEYQVDAGYWPESEGLGRGMPNILGYCSVM